MGAHGKRPRFFNDFPHDRILPAQVTQCLSYFLFVHNAYLCLGSRINSSG